MVITILKGYMVCLIILIMVYVVRHFVFAVNRLAGRQRLYYNDVITSEMKSVTVVVPMHNEEQVLSYVLDALLQCEYDREKLEIIPVNDNSTDKTKELLDAYHEKYAFIRPLHRDCEERGKPAGLNDAIRIAKGEIIIVFAAPFAGASAFLGAGTIVDRWVDANETLFAAKDCGLGMSASAGERLWIDAYTLALSR